MEIVINAEMLNTIIDADQLTTSDLGYLLRLTGLLEPHSCRLQFNTKRELCSAMGVSLSAGSGAMRALESASVLIRDGQDFYLSEELVTGGE